MKSLVCLFLSAQLKVDHHVARDHLDSNNLLLPLDEEDFWFHSRRSPARKHTLHLRATKHVAVDSGAMRESTALLFRSLKKHIHPQLPLSPRQSKQLLGLLTSSFRQHLDREHAGAPVGGPKTVDSPVRTALHTPVSPDIRQTSHYVAKSHLQLILTNPLFACTEPRGTTVGDRSGSEALQRLLKDPMNWLRQHVARGTATSSTARVCLETLRDSFNHSSELSVEEAMKTSEAGSIVFTWLRCNGIAASTDFLKDSDLLGNLMEFLVAEGRQDELLTWVWSQLKVQGDEETRCQTKDGQTRVVFWNKIVVRAIVNVQLSRKNGDIEALSTFLNALASRKMATNHLGHRLSPEMVHMARRLSYKLRTRPALIGCEDLFRRFLDTVPLWAPDVKLERAFLLIRSPQGPDPRAGLRYLRTHFESADVTQHINPRRRRTILELCLETAQVLLHNGNHADGAWVLENVRDRYAQELRLSTDSETSGEKAADEAENLELLECLSHG